MLPTVVPGGDSDGGIFRWLEGCGATPDKSSLEVWVIDNKESLSGFAVMLVDNTVRFYEVLSIRQDDEARSFDKQACD